MSKSPFKFLDSYTKEDKDIFFGRDREIEEMYQKVFESKMLLVYGISGTGKTSLINCGLANKFEDSDWLPVSIRRGKNIIASLVQGLGKVALSKNQSAVDSR
ncbi:MAG: ATP-binding protein, partial [Bacteroidales bacterium]|nr:ATP-binding protein [Bacteroidales bacterium]